MLTTRSDHIVATEYRDLQTNAMAVDSQGKFALLASKRCIALVDLDDPEQRIGRISRTSKWEVTSAMWNPHKSHAEYFVTATNLKVDLYRWHDYSELKQDSQFKAHTRVISDLDWSYTNPYFFATSSVDTYIFLWDIRDSRRPALSLSAVAGASQVKFNKINGDVLASSHDGDLRIWDQRKGTTPINYITAHLAKIHGVDWSPSSESKLATSSQDCTVKFWDLTNPKRAVDQLTTGSPVWRARYTPFGSGLITAVVPQLRRGENTLLLWNTESLQRPVHTFVGHSDVILEFQWRRLQRKEHGPKSIFEWDDTDAYQLVTWSKDQSLRIWKIEPGLQETVGQDFDGDEEEEEDGEDGSEAEENDGAAEERRFSLLFEGQRDRTATTETRSEYDIIEVEEARTLEEKEREIMEREEQEGKDDRKPTSASNANPPHTGKKQKHSESSSAIPPQPRTLKQEFDLLNKDIPNISVCEVNTQNRRCRISATAGDAGIDIDVGFPVEYPALKAPSFDIIKAKNLDSVAQTNIVQAMKDKSLKHVKKSQACLEPCIRQLRDTLDEVHFNITQEEAEKSGSPTKEIDRPASREASLGPSFIPTSSSFNPRGEFPYGLSPDVDASVPFPRTSGARFCGAFLVIFQRDTKQSELTPRSLSALAAHASLRQSTQAQGTATQFNKSIYNLGRSPPGSEMMAHFLKPRKGSLRPRIKSKRGQVIERHSVGELKDVVGPISTSGTQNANAALPHTGSVSGFHWRQNDIPSVEIFDASCIFPFDRRLAANYIIDSRDPNRMCTVNAAAAAAAGRQDLAQLWNLVKQMAGRVKLDAESVCHDAAPWSTHPYGFSLVDSIMRHLVSQSDVQTLSMISCAFGGFRVDGKNPDSECSSPCLSADGSTATYESAASTQLPNDSVLLRRSSSWCEMSYEVLQPPPETTVPVESCLDRKQQIQHPFLALPAPPNSEIEFLKRCDKFKTVYSELLYRWRLLVKRCELLKCTSQTPSPHRGLEWTPVCPTCEPSSGATAMMTATTASSKDRTSLGCTKCKRSKLTCAICRLTVKGLSTFCPSCAHGGHSIHMVSWFKSHNVCPTGCGCQCLRQLCGEKSPPSNNISALNSNDSSTSSFKKDEDSESGLSLASNLPWVIRS